jgi:glycosyltransferase involved in cell wall biosynthesis
MSGCPVITFDVGSVTDVIEDGVTGVVVPRSDVTLMADVAARLLGEPAARHAMSAAGRRRSELFSTARTASMYEDCFRALAGVATVEP